MRPEDSRRTSPLVPNRPDPQAGSAHAPTSQTTNQAAAGIVRNQIDTIYHQNTETYATQGGQASQSPYDRTHEADRTQLQAEQWRHYHSAWQDYYRQYYERYYLGEVYRMRQTAEGSQSDTPPPTAQPHAQPTEELPENIEALHSLRSDLLSNIRSSAIKVRKSQHFMPFAVAGLTMVMYLFLQYNSFVFGRVQAYVSPGSIDPANIIVDPNINVPVSNEPRLVIPKINVDVPVEYNTTADQASQLKAMEGGVAWFGIPGARSRPGQIGNTVLAGHSSNDLFDPGDYKFIFAQLDKLIAGDTFYLNYEGKRYVYSVTKKEVVRPTDVHKLVYDTDQPVVTLITCVPIGTARDRLLVTAEQISPDPAQAAPAPDAPDADAESQAMPGNAPTLIERLFSS